MNHAHTCPTCGLTVEAAAYQRCLACDERMACLTLEALARDREALPDILRRALRAVDAGDCNSGGDYHASAVGRHCDSNGGRDTCPACLIRRALRALNASA